MPYWDDFFFFLPLALTSDIKIIRKKGYLWSSRNLHHIRDDHTGWTQTDFLSKANISPKLHPNTTLNPLLLLTNFSQQGRKGSTSGFLPRWYFLDRGFYLTAVPVKTCKRGSTTLCIASLLKFKLRKPQGLNFCHCNLVLL